MRLLDLYPTCGAFVPGQTVTVTVELALTAPASVALRLTIVHLATPVDVLFHHVLLPAGQQTVNFTWSAPADAPRGYGATVELLDEMGHTVALASTAFDVLPNWTTFPRYGFLCDFSPGRTDVASTVATLARFHVNGLQFYDWQYRHDALVSPTEVYSDPLGRALSLRTVREFIDAAHAHGIAAMPYLAIYGASMAYWRAHLADALYDAAQQPMKFGDDFLGLMNPAPGSGWTRHLLAECAQVLQALPFDGLHVDQYGEPKMAFDATGQPVDLPAAFAAFNAALKAAHPQAAVVFNAVGNWPIEALAPSPEDFVYIEIWPPDVTYRAVQAIVKGARALSSGKPVVIALYIPTDRIVNIRLLDALIFSCGGARIELGEPGRLLADPYFPKHQPLSSELAGSLRRYYDFVVRYGELIGPVAGHSAEGQIQTPDGVWAIGRASANHLTVCLLNLTGLAAEPRWDEVQPAPASLTHVPVKILLDQPVQQAWWANADAAQPDLTPLTWQSAAGAVSVIVPTLDTWAIVTFQLASSP